MRPKAQLNSNYSILTGFDLEEIGDYIARDNPPRTVSFTGMTVGGWRRRGQPFFNTGVKGIRLFHELSIFCTQGSFDFQKPVNPGRIIRNIFRLLGVRSRIGALRFSRHLQVLTAYADDC